ncbi:hypothetical protein GQ457_16G012850 [Hibiscus cannabinus]
MRLIENLKELYVLGVRKIGVFSTPPIGCVPSQRTLGGGIERECAEDYNVATKLFNNKLISVLNSFRTSMPDGFEVVNKGCCGIGNIEVVVLCNQLSPLTCTNVDKYISWDSYHPTEKVYRVLVTRVIQKEDKQQEDLEMEKLSLISYFIFVSLRLILNNER